MVCGTKRGHATRTFGKVTTRMPKPKANLAHGGDSSVVAFVVPLRVEMR